MSNEIQSSGRSADDQRLMDELLRAGVPEIKLALGEAIDRENARPLPSKYARLLPATLLVVTLRPDAARALTPIAADLERELTDSCNRHGALYDRAYKVKLQRSDDPDASLYTVAAQSGRDVGAEAPPEAAESAPAQPAPTLPRTDHSAVRPGDAAPSGWEAGRWVLIVEDLAGAEREVFRLGEPTVTVGRHTDDPELRATISISDAPHVSRRQLAFRWESRDGAPGFRVYNLGLNEVHLPGLDIPGARAGRDADLASVDEAHIGWLPPGVPLRIGEQGPALRIEEIPPAEDEVRIDPDATVFE